MSINEQIEKLQEVKKESEKFKEYSEAESLFKKVSNAKLALESLESEFLGTLELLEKLLSEDTFKYLLDSLEVNPKKETSKKDKTPSAESLYCKVLKEFFLNDKNFRMAIKEVYGSDSLKTLEKAVKNVIWSGQQNGLITVVKSASFKEGLFTEPEVTLTDKGKSLIC